MSDVNDHPVNPRPCGSRDQFDNTGNGSTLSWLGLGSTQALQSDYIVVILICLLQLCLCFGIQDFLLMLCSNEQPTDLLGAE